MIEAKELIAKLNLKPLPEEGGYYRETYRSDAGQLQARSFGIESDSNRCISTGIYYLVVPESFSALHRVKSDEMFHFYSGDSVEMIQIDENGKLERFTLGSAVFNGENPQVLVRRGVWQGLRLKPGGKWALMGTTVAPGFEFEDFEVGHREELINQFPQLRNDIIRFTREPSEMTH
jgi:predicted cupin superfamily sugar epimerase